VKPIGQLQPGERVFRTSKFMTLQGGIALPICFSSRTKGEWIAGDHVDLAVARMIRIGTFFPLRGKRMAEKLAEPTETLDKAIEGFSKSLSRFNDLQDDFAAKAKRASGLVRDASEKLAQGIERVEKAANFERLDRYVTLLERAAAAMTTLADLEAKGKLDKIANAMR
jgi:hypothetical protein